jgi:hypothetical protein
VADGRADGQGIYYEFWSGRDVDDDEVVLVDADHDAKSVDGLQEREVRPVRWPDIAIPCLEMRT